MTTLLNENSQPTPDRYRLFPDVLYDDEATLRAAIQEFGVLLKIVKDEQGNVIDGHLRKRLADELGIDCPEEVRHFENEQEKYQFALMVNAARRHLTTPQKRDVIAAYLVRDPGISNNWLSKMLSVSVNTVISERKRLESTFQIEKLEKLRGKDGKTRNAKQQGKAKRVSPALKLVEHDDEDATPVISFTSDRDPQAVSATDANDVTAEEYEAVIDFVTAVCGWARAKVIMEKGEKKWKENQDG